LSYRLADCADLLCVIKCYRVYFCVVSSDSVGQFMRFWRITVAAIFTVAPITYLLFEFSVECRIDFRVFLTLLGIVNHRVDRARILPHFLPKIYMYLSDTVIRLFIRPLISRIDSSFVRSYCCPSMCILGVSLILLPILGVKSHKNPYFWGVNGHFQA